MGDDFNLDDALDKADIPNVHLRWIPVSNAGHADFVSPDPNLPVELHHQLGSTGTIRMRIMGVGSRKLVH